MSFSTSGVGTTPSSSPAHQLLNVKRCHSAQPSSATTGADLRELTNTLQELNNQFKKNLKILTEIKDHITKVCEKQESRPVDDNTGIHKLERVCIEFFLMY
jgi:methionine aminopeptidase